MLSDIAQEDLAAALDRVTASALLAAEIGEPPIDPLLVAQQLGIQVVVDHRQRQRARFVRLRDFAHDHTQSSIFVRPDPRPERMHWAVAHELGEALSGEVFAVLGIDAEEAPPGSRERIANALAGRILVPSAWFGDEAIECDWDLPALKRRYATASHELLARRMLDCDPLVIITVFDHGSHSFRGGNLPWPVPEMTSLERDCQQEVHERGTAHILVDGNRQVQGWPVHEPDWKREILRTECDQWCDD